MTAASNDRPTHSDEISYQTAGAVRLAFDFLRAMASSLGWRLAGALAVSVALALAEGSGVLLLVPLLAAIGLIVTDGPAGHLAAWTSQAFAFLGLEPDLPVVLMAFLAVSIVHASLSRWHLVLDPATEQRFTLAWRERLYAAIVSSRWSFLVQRRANDLAHALTRDMERVSTAAYQLLRLAATLGVTAIYVAFAMRLSGGLTLVAAAGSVGLLWLFRGQARQSTERGAAHAEADRRLDEMVHESLDSLKVAKSLGAEPRARRAHRVLARAASGEYLAFIATLARSKHGMDVISAAALSFLLFAAVTAFGLRGASLLLLMFVFSRIVPRILSLQQSIQLFAVNLPAFGRVVALCRRCEEEADRSIAEGSDRLELTRALRLDNVAFSYPSRPSRLIDGISLEIRAGETAAIVGPSGGGKSTLADILIGLLQPDSGCLAVDGAELRGENLRAWRRSIGYVPQDTFLLHESIRANLAWAAPGATETDMWEALGMAAAATFVAALPQGLETPVGDRGTRLSGGERQRISLARVLLRRPSLLVLDEATSALDSESERQILEAVARLHGRVTVLFITHRLTAVRDADVIHVLEAGRVVESGSWKTLVNASGPFRRLWDAQASTGTAPPAAQWQLA